MKIVSKLLRNQVGAGVATSLLAFGALGGGIYYMLESSGERNKLLVDMNQNSIVENTMLNGTVIRLDGAVRLQAR